ncbi:MAG: hydantoinase/oxoprolinase family protein, partial [Oscillospiraceae bacterium]|nr:hydantoinase/oxoprolinase family protein [Oscillospiraceae bacterium]
TQADIKELKKEAIDAAITSGASPDSVEVHIEIDNQTSKITAIAIGSTEAKTTDLLKECDEKEAEQLAKYDFGSKVSDIKLAEKTDKIFVFSGKASEGRTPVRIVDNKGFIKVQCSDAKVAKAKAGEYKEVVENMWKDLAIFKTDNVLRPDFYICMGPRVCDYSAVDLEQVELLMELDVVDREPNEEILIIGAKNDLN